MSVLFDASIMAAIFASLTEPLPCDRGAARAAGRVSGAGAGISVAAGSDFGGDLAVGFTGLKSRQLIVSEASDATVTIAIAVRRQSIADLRGARAKEEGEVCYDDSG